MKTLSQELETSLLAAEFSKLLELPCNQYPKTSTERLQSLFNSVNSLLKELQEADDSIFTSTNLKEQLELDLTRLLRLTINSFSSIVSNTGNDLPPKSP